jgi:response regulator RpfG family c-di-GMP phosphodiesterase
VRHHHERWDGAGYPDGLAAEAIPLGARIVAVADSIEVMSARQLYRQPRSPEEIVAELHACRGKQWDPDVIDVALALIDSKQLDFPPGGLRLLEEAAPPPQRTHLAVLLVEDDDDHAEIVTAAIERALDGAVVARARTVEDATELMNGASWSLAIVDHQLPDGVGMEILDSLRAHDPRLPIVMLTGQDSEETAINAFRHGASDFVVKGGEYIDRLTTRVRGLVLV